MNREEKYTEFFYLKTMEQVIANFSASWSRPCKSMTPAYCELADKYTSMVFLAIDVDELAVSKNTFWLPFVYLYKFVFLEALKMSMNLAP